MSQWHGSIIPQIGRHDMTKQAAFDPDTIALLKEVLLQAEETLPMQHRSSEVRVKLATGILKAAAEGERDPERLQKAALVGASVRRMRAYSQEKRPRRTRGHEFDVVVFRLRPSPGLPSECSPRDPRPAAPGPLE